MGSGLDDYVGIRLFGKLLSWRSNISMDLQEALKVERKPFGHR